MAYDKELENEIYHNALAQGLSARDAMDMARRVMGISSSPHDLYASMTDQFSDTLPYAGSRGNDYTRPQPLRDDYHEHPRGSGSRVDPCDRYESRGAYNVRKVRPACSPHGSYSTLLEYGYLDQSFRYSEHVVRPRGSSRAACEISNGYEYGYGYGYEERSSSTYNMRKEHPSDHCNGRDSATLSRPNHNTSNSYAADSGRRYNIREAVPGGSTRNPHPEFPRTQTRGGDNYFERTPPPSNYKPRGEASFDNRRTYNYPRGDGTYSTRTAVPDSMPQPSPPPCSTFPPPPRPSQHGYGTRNATPNSPRPPLVSKVLIVNLYAILGVSRTATADELKKAHRKLALQYHPDRAQINKEQATVMMAKINQAYDVLKDETHREEYDKTGEF